MFLRALLLAILALTGSLHAGSNLVTFGGQVGGASSYLPPKPYDPGGLSVDLRQYPIPGPAPTGSVTFILDGSVTRIVAVNYTSTSSVSNATVSFPPFYPGPHVAVANYSGDSYYAPGSTTFRFTITPPVFILTGGFWGYFGSPFEIDLPISNPGAAQGTVFLLDGATRVASGLIFREGYEGHVHISIYGPLSPGDHHLTIRFEGNIAIADGSVLIQIRPKPVMSLVGGASSCTIGDLTNLTISLIDSSELANGAVSLFENGVHLNTAGRLWAKSTVSVPYSCSSLGIHKLTVRFIYQPIAIVALSHRDASGVKLASRRQVSEVERPSRRRFGRAGASGLGPPPDCGTEDGV